MEGDWFRNTAHGTKFHNPAINRDLVNSIKVGRSQSLASSVRCMSLVGINSVFLSSPTNPYAPAPVAISADGGSLYAGLPSYWPSSHAHPSILLRPLHHMCMPSYRLLQGTLPPVKEGGSNDHILFTSSLVETALESNRAY